MMPASETTSEAVFASEAKPRTLQEPSPWNLPNLLTALRFGLAIVMFVLIGHHYWWLTGFIFAVACITDWLDGLAARKLGIISSFGRNFDPLVDKLLICGSFICLLPLATDATGMWPWMVVVVVSRELVVTSLRGYFESQGMPFGADKWGKLKMVLQCLALAAILLYLAVQGVEPNRQGYLELLLRILREGLIYSMLVLTVFSGLQYIWMSYQMYQTQSRISSQ